MPPKKRGRFGTKSANAKFMEKFRKNLSPKAKEKLCQANRKSVQKYRKSLTEEKKIEIKQQDIEYQRNKS